MLRVAPVALTPVALANMEALVEQFAKMFGACVNLPAAKVVAIDAETAPVPMIVSLSLYMAKGKGLQAP
jgi:hypothetical protein